MVISNVVMMGRYVRCVSMLSVISSGYSVFDRIVSSSVGVVFMWNGFLMCVSFWL